jgi:hypothetical protein
VRAAIGRLHDAGPAAGHDAGAARAAIGAGAADQPAEGARDLVVVAGLGEAPGRDELLLRVGIGGIGCRGNRRRLEPAPRGLRLGHAGASEHHDGMADVVLPQKRLGLEVFELQAQAARQLPIEETEILAGFAIAVARQDAGHRLGGAGIVMQGFGMLAGQRATAFVRRRFGHPVRIVSAAGRGEIFAFAAQPGANAPDDDAHHGDDDAGGAENVEHAMPVGRFPPHHVKRRRQDSQQHRQCQAHGPIPHHRRDNPSCCQINEPRSSALPAQP